MNSNAKMLRLTALSAFIFILPNQSKADCFELQEQARAAQAKDDLSLMKSIFDKAFVDPACSDDYRLVLGRAVSREIEKRVEAAIEKGEPPSRHERALEEVSRYAKSWRALAQLGDISKDRKDFAKAAGYYQESLAAIQDETATPKAPPPAVIEIVFKSAEEMRLAADSFVAAPVTRAGEAGGLAATSLRGFVPTKVALPIEFKYDSTEFTPKGEAAVRELLSMLRQRNGAAASLIGHTDSRGRLDYNIDLSERRAIAVAAYLRRAGYNGPLSVIGRGPTDPMKLDDPARYTPEELHQINRRVELSR